MNGTVTIPNYGNATTEGFHTDKGAPKGSINARMLPAPSTIEETGFAGRIARAIVGADLVHAWGTHRAIRRGDHEVAVRGHERIIYAHSARKIL